MGYKHGVITLEEATGLVTPVYVESAMPVIVGAAPVHNLPEGVEPPVNEPLLFHTFADFVARMGAPKAGEAASDYPLYQAAEIYLTRYACKPIVCVNIFDPKKHKREIHGLPVDDEQEAEAPNEQIEEGAEIGNEEAQTPEPEYVPDVSLVTAADVIGGVDPETLKRTGLQTVHDVYPLYRLTPGLILAPKYSKIPSVGIAIGAVCEEISGYFRAVGIIEVADDLKNYTEAPAWLNDNNLTDRNLICMFGDCRYNDQIEPGSAHLAGVMASRDADNDGIPYWSPSNKRLLAEGMVYNGEKLNLDPSRAEYLNGQGLVTGLNMVGGLVAWGDQTCAYPGVTDVKDSSIPIRRMFAFIANTLVLTNWQYVSIPVSRRRIETVQDVVNLWLNGLAACEFILGGRCVFEEVDNKTLDMMSGVYRWHVYVTPPQAGRELQFILEYDPAYLQTLVAA